ncbi:dihydrofolate reductase family protein [Solirubrobacter sp. CPCC 204708]|uniref:Dihydrofolate reductase family protein n=1 Tax=Solirubrobacter deserti TaxID=2282478 RepID=A0ABT4RMC7_9ACTN|nr:dihydrofolate reductase family protein [Solirubrobacter deserti]MBE2316704.1 dihydrofolate reductase family protein [Solirubrobacter deserti]MDA0139461.1 dihydrofolate reductase family protein [Solirubrobacter deserti]
MTATYTWDIFCTLDGYGSYDANGPGDWGGYWSKQGPEFLAHREAMYDAEQRMVFGAKTYKQYVEMLGASAPDPLLSAGWITRMRNSPTFVASKTLKDPLEWETATVMPDAVDDVARFKRESDVPLRSHGSLSLNWALMAAGLVDRVQVAIFPVISGRTGTEPILGGAADFDLELLEHRTLDGRIQELVYKPSLH